MPFQTISDFAPRGLSSAQRAWQYGEDEEAKMPEQPVPWASQAPTYTPSKSLGSQAADLGFSALGVVGSAFDIPGSMVRDVAAIPTAMWGSNDANVDYNPFNQLLPWNWFDQDGRTDGRELNRAWAGGTGAVSDEDNWGNLGAGIATEIALDPLTYLTFGGSAYTRGGDALSKVASRREIADVATQLARDANIRTTPVGKTVAQQVLTPRNVLDAKAAANKVEPAQEYANFADSARKGWFGRKVDVTNAEVEKMLGDSIGGMARFRVPMLPRKWQDSTDGLLRDRFIGGRVGNLADLARVGRASDIAVDVGMGTVPLDTAIPPAAAVPPATTTEPMPPAATQVSDETMFQPSLDSLNDGDIPRLFQREPESVTHLAKMAMDDIKSEMAQANVYRAVTHDDLINRIDEMTNPNTNKGRQIDVLMSQPAPGVSPVEQTRWWEEARADARDLVRRERGEGFVDEAITPNLQSIRPEDIPVVFAGTSQRFQNEAAEVLAELRGPDGARRASAGSLVDIMGARAGTPASEISQQEFLQMFPEKASEFQTRPVEKSVELDPNRTVTYRNEITDSNDPAILRDRNAMSIGNLKEKAASLGIPGASRMQEAQRETLVSQILAELDRLRAEKITQQTTTPTSPLSGERTAPLAGRVRRSEATTPPVQPSVLDDFNQVSNDMAGATSVDSTPTTSSLDETAEPRWLDDYRYKGEGSEETREMAKRVGLREKSVFDQEAVLGRGKGSPYGLAAWVPKVYERLKQGPITDSELIRMQDPDRIEFERALQNLTVQHPEKPVEYDGRQYSLREAATSADSTPTTSVAKDLSGLPVPAKMEAFVKALENRGARYVGFDEEAGSIVQRGPNGTTSYPTFVMDNGVQMSFTQHRQVPVYNEERLAVFIRDRLTMDPDVITFEAIVAPEGTRGGVQANSAMRRLVEAADEAGVTLRGEVAPMKNVSGGVGLDSEKLKRWYARFGFETEDTRPGNPIIVRRPKETTQPTTSSLGTKTVLEGQQKGGDINAEDMRTQEGQRQAPEGQVAEAAGQATGETPSPVIQAAGGVDHKEIIRAAIASQLPNGRVRLADIREALPNISREELDTALFQMEREQLLSLMRLDNPREITARDADAALKTKSGGTNHILYVQRKGKGLLDPPAAIDDAAQPSVLDQANEVSDDIASDSWMDDPLVILPDELVGLSPELKEMGLVASDGYNRSTYDAFIGKLREGKADEAIEGDASLGTYRESVETTLLDEGYTAEQATAFTNAVEANVRSADVPPAAIDDVAQPSVLDQANEVSDDIASMTRIVDGQADDVGSDLVFETEELKPTGASRQPVDAATVDEVADVGDEIVEMTGMSPSLKARVEERIEGDYGVMPVYEDFKQNPYGNDEFGRPYREVFERIAPRVLEGTDIPPEAVTQLADDIQGIEPTVVDEVAETVADTTPPVTVEKLANDNATEFVLDIAKLSDSELRDAARGIGIDEDVINNSDREALAQAIRDNVADSGMTMKEKSDTSVIEEVVDEAINRVDPPAETNAYRMGGEKTGLFRAQRDRLRRAITKGIEKAKYSQSQVNTALDIMRGWAEAWASQDPSRRAPHQFLEKYDVVVHENAEEMSNALGKGGASTLRQGGDGDWVSRNAEDGTNVVHERGKYQIYENEDGSFTAAEIGSGGVAFGFLPEWSSLESAKSWVNRHIEKKAKESPTDVATRQANYARGGTLFQGSTDAATAGASAKQVDAARKEWAEKGTQSSFFKGWFGDWEGDSANASKVVDEEGKPLVVYHGTDQEFDVFENPYAEDMDGNWFMFATQPAYSGKFSEGRGGNIKPVYLDIKNPLDLSHLPARRGDVRNKLLDTFKKAGLDVETLSKTLPHEYDLHQFINRKGFRDQLVSELKDRGYDGIRMPDAVLDIVDNSPAHIESTTFIPFSPTQIKSATANAGTFDSQNPSILFQGGAGGSAYRTVDDGNTTQYVVDGKVVGEVISRKGNPIPEAMALENMGIEGAGEVRRMVGIEVFGKDNRRKGIGTNLYLSHLVEHPETWFYNSQASEDATKTLLKMQEDGLIEMVLDQAEESRRLKGYTNTLGSRAIRITPKGLDRARSAQDGARGDALFQGGTDEFPSVLFQGGEVEPPYFYSKLEAVTASDKVGGKIGFKQLHATLKKQGVKDDEIEDLKLKEFFGGGTKTKQELLDYVRDNSPVVEVTETTEYADSNMVPGGVPGSGRTFLMKVKKLSPQEREYEAYVNELGRKYGEEIVNRQYGATVTQKAYDSVLTAEEQKRFSDLSDAADASHVETPAYQGGHFDIGTLVHFRVDEVLLPNGKKEIRIQEVQSDWHQAATKQKSFDEKLEFRESQRGLNVLYSDEAFAAWRAENKAYLDEKYPLENYYSKPSRRPPTDEELTRGFTIEQTTHDGQSTPDIRQDLNGQWFIVDSAGRRGDMSFGTKEEAETAWNASREFYSVIDEDGSIVIISGGSDRNQLMSDAAFTVRQQIDTDTYNLIPDAPFKSNWHMLALKQILAMAAREGYETVSLVRGEDIAKAVGGPPKALGSFYNKKLLNELKKYTKRWGSYLGESNVPKDPRNYKWEDFDYNAATQEDIQESAVLGYNDRNAVAVIAEQQSGHVIGKVLQDGDEYAIVDILRNHEFGRYKAAGEAKSNVASFADEYKSKPQWNEEVTFDGTEFWSAGEDGVAAIHRVGDRYKAIVAGEEIGEFGTFAEAEKSLIDYSVDSGDDFFQMGGSFNENNIQWVQRDDGGLRAEVGGRDVLIAPEAGGGYSAYDEAETVGNYATLDEAKLSLVERIIGGGSYTGDVQVFQVTDEMRRDLLGPQPLYQGENARPRGAVEIFEDANSVIHLIANKDGGSDFSTIIHEAFHPMLHHAAPDTRMRLDRYYGVVPGEKWTVDQQETFTTDFERYMRKGVAPEGAPSYLVKAFEAAKRWLMDVYGAIVNSPMSKEIPDDLRAIFDELFEVNRKERIDPELATTQMDAAVPQLDAANAPSVLDEAGEMPADIGEMGQSAGNAAESSGDITSGMFDIDPGLFSQTDGIVLGMGDESIAGANTADAVTTADAAIETPVNSVVTNLPEESVGQFREDATLAQNYNETIGQVVPAIDGEVSEGDLFQQFDAIAGGTPVLARKSGEWDKGAVTFVDNGGQYAVEYSDGSMHVYPDAQNLDEAVQIHEAERQVQSIFQVSEAGDFTSQAQFEGAMRNNDAVAFIDEAEKAMSGDTTADAIGVYDQDMLDGMMQGTDFANEGFQSVFGDFGFGSQVDELSPGAVADETAIPTRRGMDPTPQDRAPQMRQFFADAQMNFGVETVREAARTALFPIMHVWLKKTGRRTEEFYEVMRGKIDFNELGRIAKVTKGAAGSGDLEVLNRGMIEGFFPILQDIDPDFSDTLRDRFDNDPKKFTKAAEDYLENEALGLPQEYDSVLEKYWEAAKATYQSIKGSGGETHPKTDAYFSAIFGRKESPMDFDAGMKALALSEGATNMLSDFANSYTGRLLRATFQWDKMNSTQGMEFTSQASYGAEDALLNSREAAEKLVKPLHDHPAVNMDRLTEKAMENFPGISKVEARKIATQEQTDNYILIQDFIEKDRIDPQTGERVAFDWGDSGLGELEDDFRLMMTAKDRSLEAAMKSGVNDIELQDDLVNYLPRKINTQLRKAATKQKDKVYEVSHDGQIGRHSEFKNVPMGIAGIQRISMQPGYISGWADGKKMNNTAKQEATELMLDGPSGDPATNPYDFGRLDYRPYQYYENHAEKLDALEADYDAGNVLNDTVMKEVEVALRDVVPLPSGARRPIETTDRSQWIVESWKQYKQNKEDAFALAERFARLPKGHVDDRIPMFQVNPLSLTMQRVEKQYRAAAAADAISDFLASPQSLIPDDSGMLVHDGTVLPALRIGRGDGYEKTLEQVLKETKGINPDVMKAIIRNKAPHLVENTAENSELQTLQKNIYIHDNAVKHINAVIHPWIKSPNGTDNWVGIKNMFMWYGNMFRSNVTGPFPAFHGRNLIGGTWMNFVRGYYGPVYDPRSIANAIRSGKSAEKHFRGQMIDMEGVNIGEFKGLNNEEKNKKLAEIVFREKLISGDQGIVNDLEGLHTDPLTASMPGIHGERSFAHMVSPLEKHIGEAPEGTTWFDKYLAFWKVAGVGESPLNPNSQIRKEDLFLPTRWGRHVGSYAEGVNRIGPFIALLRQGYTPRRAADLVKEAQADYSKLSVSERNIKRFAIPFYSFARRVSPVIYSDMITNPGGPRTQVLRVVRNTREDEPMPAHLEGTVAIPFGVKPDGTKTYLTGLGLPMEQSLEYAAAIVASGTGNFDDALRPVTSMVNPAVRWVLEASSGTSTWQDGGHGQGRAIREMDPPMGRTIQNFSDLATGERTIRAEPLGAQWLEHAASAMPTSRYATTARQWTDPRKVWNDPLSLGKHLIDQTTGLKMYDVSPGAQDAILSQRLGELVDSMGGRTFTESYLPDYVKANLTPEEQALWEKIQAEKKRMRQDSRARKEQRNAEAAM